MTAAKVMDIISRLPGCAGQAADAVSACTLVKMEDAIKRYLKFQSQNVPVWKTQSFLLSETHMVMPLTGLFVHREKGSFLSVYVDAIKLARKKHNIDPMWKVLNKEVDLGEPTSFLDHVYLGCTQRQCEISKDIVDNYRTMFESQNFREEN